MIDPTSYKALNSKSDIFQLEITPIVSDTGVALRKAWEMTGKFISISYRSFMKRFLPLKESYGESPDFTGLFNPINDINIRIDSDLYDPFVRHLLAH